MFSVRLVSSDSYQAPPLPQLDPTFSEFRGSEIKNVPIIRIFGSTATGEKTCLHVHGVFPYLYVPYTGEEDPTSLAYRLAASLDAAINVSLGSATSNTQHVYLIQRVSGIPFYGYHRKEHQYLKIYFYNPAMIKRAADLLQNGSVLNQSLQPHEAHIPYLLQFMIDYNVYGMSLVNLSGVKHRRLTQALAELTSSGQSVASENNDIEYLPATIERQSTCEIEIDALASDIMNRREIENGLELNPGLAAIWEEERARRAQAGLQGGDSQLVNPKSPPRPTFHPTDNDIYQEQRLARRLLAISQCDESTLSTTTNQSVTYAAEVHEGENLLNSSYLPFSRPTAERTQLVERDDPTLHATFLESPTDVTSQRMTPECSILGTDDMPLIDLLIQLADEGAENKESVDMDSLLGSQVSALLNDERSDNEDDDDAIDLNLTSLQLDSLSSLEIAGEQGNEPATGDQNPLSTIELSPFISSYEISSCSRSADEEKTRKGCRVPQYDGAGDVSPTLLNSDDEDNSTNAKEFSHLPEYNGNSKLASESRKFDHLEETLKISSDNAVVASKDGDKSDEPCHNSPPVDAAIDSSSLLPVLSNDSFLAQYNGLSYEPLDRLLEIGEEFVPDLEGLHSSMEIGILLSSADSDSPESVDEAIEAVEERIALEAVLNGDPCFTESAEVDKSDLAELQDQYVSLLGNSLLPDVHTNLRIDSDLGNSSNLSDSDYQTGEKPCEILLNERSPRSSVTSRESSSSSENVAPNIQEPEAKSCSRGKFNANYALDRESRNCKDTTRISTDNSDYNCNVVATWAELQNLQFVEKEKMDGRLGRSRDKGQYSQGPRQTRRKASRRSDERAPSQILRLDSEKITNSTATLAPLQVNNNCSLSSRKNVASSEGKSLMKKSDNSLSSTILESRLTESLVDIIEESSSESPRVPHIAAEVEIEQQPFFTGPDASARLDAFHRSIIGSGNPYLNTQYSFLTSCDDKETESVVPIVDIEDSLDNQLKKSDETLRTEEIPECSSYYSSQRSQRDYTIDGFEHWHCQLSEDNRIIQDEVFTADQVWVIEKRKRGRKARWPCSGVCSSSDCSLPIVPLQKIDTTTSDESTTIVEDSEKNEETDLPIDKNTAEAPENQTVESITDQPVEKSNLPKKRAVARKFSVDTTSSSSESSTEENENDWAEAEGRNFVKTNYGIRRRYTKKKHSITRNSKKLISTRASKNIRPTRITRSTRSTRNGVRRRVPRAAKCEEDNLPGIPGIDEYRSSRTRGRSKQDVFTCYNGVVSDNKPTETTRKTKNKLQTVLCTDWESKREASSCRPNGLVNIVQNGFSDNKKTAVSPDRRTINSSQFDFPSVSPIPKKNRRRRDTSKDLSHLMNRSSTPKKISSETQDSSEEKLPECVALDLMMREVKSRSTRAKLQMLLKKRQEKETGSTTERILFRSEKRNNEIKTATAIASGNLELPPISDIAYDTRNSVGDGEIHDKLNTDNTTNGIEPSFEAITNDTENGQKSCEPVGNSFDVVDNTEIFANSTLNDEAVEIFEAQLEILGTGIPEANPAEESSNERKDLSYQNDQFASTIVDENFFSGTNYTIDAVSQEMPACLFEEDSNSIDKRSPKKVSDNGSQSVNNSQNIHDVYSDLSVDPRDLDVYDVESLTPSSSLAALDEATLDVAVTSLNTSEATEFSLVETSMNSEAQSVSTNREKSQVSKSEETEDSSFEEASPEFEALSPTPQICDLGKSLEEEFTVHSTVATAQNRKKFNNSSTNATIDDSIREAREGKVGSDEDNSELDHEIQDLVSQVIVQFENESNLPCECESALIMGILPPNISERSVEIARRREISRQRIEVPIPLTRATQNEKEGLPIAAQDNVQLLQKNEWTAFSTSETNGELKAPAEGQKTFPTEADSEKVDFFDIIQNKAQSDVLKSQIEFQEITTRESELMDRKLESRDENNELTPSLAKKPIEADVNFSHSETENCISKNEELTNISKDELSIKPLKCRPVSIKLVNIDLSRFDGFQPKNFTQPNGIKLESMQETIENDKVESLIEKNILELSPCNIFNEHIEQIVPVEFDLKEQKLVEDKEINSWIERSILESATMMEISGQSETLEKAISMESTTPIESFDQDQIFENTIPVESTAPNEISNRNETFKNTNPIESIAPIENLNHGETFEKTISMESTKSIETFDQGETFENIIPMESTAPNEISNQNETFENTIPTESIASNEISIQNETCEKTIPMESTTVIGVDDQSVTCEKTILMKMKPSSQKRIGKKLRKSKQPARRSMRKCAEKTRQKLSQQASQPSSAESQASTEENIPFVTKNDYQWAESWLQNQSEDLSSQNEYFPEDSSTDELSPREGLTEERSDENSVEAVLSTQEIADENTRPKYAYNYMKMIRSKGGRLTTNQQLKQTAQKRVRLEAQRLAKMSFDSKPSVQQNSSDNTDQENTCSLEAEKSSPISDSVKRIIDDNNMNSKTSETPVRRKRSTKIPEANVQKPSTKSTATFEESAKDTSERASEETEEKTVTEKVVKGNNDEKISLEADNSETSALLQFPEPQSIFGEKIPESSESLQLKITEYEEPRSPSTLRRRGRRGESLKKKSSKNVATTNSEGFDSSLEKIVKVNSGFLTWSKRSRHLQIKTESKTRKKRRCMQIMSDTSAKEPSSEVISLQDESARNTVEKTSESLEESSLLSQEIGKENPDFATSARAEIPEVSNTISSLEKSAQDIVEENSQGLILSLQKIADESIELETCVKAKRRRRPRKISDPNVSKFCAESVPSTEQSGRATHEKHSEITEESRISQKINEGESRTKTSASTQDISEENSQGLVLSPQKITEDSTEPEICVKTKRRGRPRKISDPIVRKSFAEPVPSTEENDQDTDEMISKDLELAQKVMEEESKSKTSISAQDITEETSERFVLSPQKIAANNTEPEACVKTKRRGRPRKISDPIVQKSFAEPVPSTEESAQSTDEKHSDIFEESIISQIIMEAESKSKTFASTQNITEDTHHELVLSRQEIVEESTEPETCVKIKRRGRSRKVSDPIGLKSSAEPLSSTDENVQGTEKVSEISDDSKLSREMDEEERESKTSTGTQDITEDISQGLALSPQKIVQDSTEPETCVKAKRRGRPRKISDPIVLKSFTESVPPIEENAQGTDKKISKISEDSKLSQKIEEEKSESNTSVGTQDIAEEISQELVISPPKISEENTEPKTIVKAKRRGRSRKISEPIDLKSSAEHAPSTEENYEKVFEIFEDSKLSQKIEEEISESNTSVGTQDIAEEISQELVISPQKISEENTEPETIVKAKRRGRSRKISDSIGLTSSAEHAPSTDENDEKVFEILEDSKLSQKVEEKKNESTTSATTRDITEKMSQELVLSPQKIAEESEESKTCVKTKRRGRSRKISESIDLKSSAEHARSTEENDEKVFEIFEDSKLSQKVEEQKNESTTSATTQDITEKMSQELVLSPQKIAEESEESKACVKTKRRGRSRKILDPIVLKSFAEPVPSTEENVQGINEVSEIFEDSKLSPEIDEEPSESKSSTSTQDITDEISQQLVLSPAKIAEENAQPETCVKGKRRKRPRKISDPIVLKCAEPLPSTEENAQGTEEVSKMSGDRKLSQKIEEEKRESETSVSTQDITEKKSQELVLSPQQITEESTEPESCVKTKRRGRSQKISDTIVEKTRVEIAPLTEESAEDTDAKISDESKLSQKIDEKESESTAIAGTQDITQEIPQELVLSPQKIAEESTEPETCVKIKRRGRSRKPSEPIVQESSEEPVPSTEESTQDTDEKISDESKLSQKVDEEESGSMAIVITQDITEEISQGLVLSPQKITEESTESETCVKTKRRGRSRKILDPNVQKSSVERVTLTEVTTQDTDKISGESKLSQKIDEEESGSTAIVMVLSPQKIAAENTEPEACIKTNRRGRSRKISDPNVQKSSAEPVPLTEESAQGVDEKISDESKLSDKIDEEESGSKISAGTQDITEEISQELVLSPQKITGESTEPETCAETKRKGRSRKTSDPIIQKSSAEPLPSTEESAQGTDENHSEISKESILSQKIEEEEEEESKSKTSTSVQDITEEISQGLVLSPEKIVEEITEPEISVKTKRRRRPRKISDPNVQKSSAERVPSTEESAQDTDERISKELKSSQKIEEDKSESKSSLNSSPRKGAQDITEEVSQELNLPSQKIAEESTEPETNVKTKKKCRRRKISKTNVKEHFTETISSKEENARDTDKKASEILEKLKLSQKIEQEDSKSKPPAYIEISEIIIQNATAEKSTRELELSSQKIAKERTEPETYVKVKRKGRSRKISIPNVQKPSAQPVPSIDKSGQATDEKTFEIPEESILQKVEIESESKSFFKVKSTETDASKLSPVLLSSTSCKVSSKKNYEDDLDSKILINPSLQQVSVRLVSKITVEANVVGNNKSDISYQSSEVNARMLSPKSESSTQETIRNIVEEASSETDSQQNFTKEDGKSKISETSSQEPSSESKSSSIETTQDTTKDVFHEIDSLLPSSTEENVESMISVEPKKRNRSSKKQQNNTQKFSSEAQPSLKENGQDNNENSQKLELLTKAIKKDNFEQKSTEKKKVSFEKRPESNLPKLSIEEKSKSIIHAVSVTLEKIPITVRRRGRSGKTTESNFVNSESVEENIETVTEKTLRESELLTREDTETKNSVIVKRRRPEKTTESTSQSTSSESNYLNTADKASQEMEILSLKVTEKKTEVPIATSRKRGRSEKNTQSNSQSTSSENSDLTSVDKAFKETEILLSKITEEDTKLPPVTFRRRGRSGKNTESNLQSTSSKNNYLNTADKASEETEILSQKSSEEDMEVSTVTHKRRVRFAKCTERQKISIEKSDQDIAEKTLQKSESLVPKVTMEPVEDESVNAKNKGRGRKISKAIVVVSSVESTSFPEEITQKITQKTCQGIELSSETLEEEQTEKKTPAISNKKDRLVRNPEGVPKPSQEETNFVIATRVVTEDTTESKTPARSKKRTRSAKSPEDNSEKSVLFKEPTGKICDETLPESNLLAQKIAEEMTEAQTSERPRKRVHFDESFIRECTVHLRPFEPLLGMKMTDASPTKHQKNSVNREPSSSTMKKARKMRKLTIVCERKLPEIACLSRDLSTISDDQQHRQGLAEPEGNNGVATKSECTISSSDNASLDLSSLQDGFTRQQRHDDTRVIPARLTKARAQEQTNEAEETIPSTKTQWNDLKVVGRTKKIPFFTNFEVRPLEPTGCQSQSEQRGIAFVQPQEPKIILKRLSRDTLKNYGLKFNAKNKTFMTTLKKHRPDRDYRVPAYDGAADFSSSDSDEDSADVTVAREEKRVCVYQSGKKSTNTKHDAIFTPRKRKFDEAEAQSPTSKHRALAIPGPSTKTPYRSPNRTSMLKSPGRVSGYYPPLQIIVTSPKVRKETSEPRDTDVRLENRDVSASTGACLTPRHKIDQRLHENLLRGRITAMKLPRNDIGNKRAPVATMGSQRLGELDEIKSSVQRECNALNTATIMNECSEATGNQTLTETLRDWKDVRKKLEFSTAGDERRRNATDGTLNTELNHQSANLRTSSKPIGRYSPINKARESLEVVENLTNRETTELDPQPGPSRSDGIPADENLGLYGVTTDEESDDDDACNVTFTQYIDSQIGKNQVFTVGRSLIGADSNEFVSLRPKFNPPSCRRIIDTTETYGIPKYRNQEPFFSDEADVLKPKELAQKMLKVPGKGLKDLPAFVSSVEGVTGLARWRRMKINEFQPALAKSKDISAIHALVGDARVSLTPLIKPPTQMEVNNWLRARKYLENKKKQEEMAKKPNEAQNIEIKGQIAGTEEDECESNASDLSVIEASPEKIVADNNSGKPLNYTLKMKLAKRGLFKKAEEYKGNNLMSSEGEEAKDSVKACGSDEIPSATKNFNSIEMDPSLLSVLEKSRLFKDQQTSRHLGVSLGQIEFLSDSTRTNVSNENLQNAKALTRYQYLTIMCLEVHVATRGDLLPDAQYDSIAAIFYSVQSDVPPTSNIKPLEHGVIILADEDKAKNKRHYSHASNLPWSISFANSEEALLNALVTLITRIDPEIIIGWEIESLSWGYVFQRASRLGMNLFKRISRIPATQCKWEAPAPDIESVADVKLPGRIVLDIWRLMRHEAALLSYTFESMMHHILNERVPCPSFKILTEWWNLEQAPSSRWRVVEHYSLRVLGVFRILNQLDIIGRTSELARLFGIQFYEVFSRGSQYRVESVMHRLAKPLNYIAVSPSPLQRASMRAMEALPLIMEPESMFYSDPLIVLDFQSLYPSIIIAHNYCFSTCLGRIEHIGQPQPFEFGAYTLRVPKSTSMKLQGKVNFAPCGVAFVKPEIRLGILPRMLTEILETRFMVKKAMKDHKQADKTLQRALHSRQHGLKFLANVTYGYTAANFSGRMPCIEVGDSVVSKSKETLERAIKLVESTPKWGARVVYGDTDSLFILVPGKSKADAFVIGEEIADAVTASNPPPIKLRFEKVMYPSILQTKKRYCGYMYETPDQQTPTYLAKGIETVRRDGCPAVSKVLEKTLKILFETKDVSLVKKYVTRQLDKILRGKVSIQDLTFAKEFRGLKGYKAKACVPALELTRRLMRKDPRAVPRNSERVRYVIVAGAPNQALIQCVRTPWELINDPGLRPNAIYYVTRVIIPPLNRCLNLMGVDVNAWYREMPHRQILDNPIGQPIDKQKLTIFQYFGTIVCVSCGQPSNKGICMECLAHSADTLVVLHEKLRWLNRTYDQVTAICQSCVGRADVADCSSLDCPVLYRRAQAQRELSQVTHLRSIIKCGNNLEF